MTTSPGRTAPDVSGCCEPACDDKGMYPGLITVRWLASRCGVSVGAVYCWIRSGTVTATRLGGAWRMWRPTVAAELAAGYDIGWCAARPPSCGPAGYVDTGTVAAWLGISDASARQLARDGVLPSVRVGPAFRFHWPSLLDLLLTDANGSDTQYDSLAGTDRNGARVPAS